MNDNDIPATPLYKGLCRPPMFRGVPYDATIVNIMVCGCGFIMSGNFLWPLVGLPLLHGICWLLCLRDINTFSVIFVSISKTPWTRNYFRYWHCNSYGP